MLWGEMNAHLRYENNSKISKETDNRRNGYITKNVKTSMSEMNVDVPRDRDGSFDSVIIPKRTKDISATIEDIYGFKISHETISQITDCVMDELNKWLSRPLKKCYPFVFVDRMYVTMRYEYECKESAVYTILGYDTKSLWTG